jgi:excinuclease ABC subunit A
VKKNTSEDLSVIGRLRDSLELAYKTGSDRLVLYFPDRKKSEAFEYYSRKAACPQCDFSLEPLTLSHFSFNSHYGACEHCHGLGIESVFLEEKITNPALSIAEGAILPWTQHGYYITILEAVCKKYNIDLHCPYGTLSEKDRNAILHGVPETFTIEYDFTDGIKKKHSVRYE